MSDAFSRVIEENRAEHLCVALTEFSGHRLIDIRTYSDTRTGPVETRAPTRKGVSLNIAKLPELIEALQAAHAEAVRLGLLDGGDHE